MNMKGLQETLCLGEMRVEGKLPVIYMPNEIFDDIQQHVKGNSSLVASVYACYFLDCLLYRYAIYGINHQVLKVPIKKQILGFTENSRVIDPIIKKGGILNVMGYTKPESNFPISWSLDAVSNEPSFTLLKDKMVTDDGIDYGYLLPESIIKSVSNRTKISYPIKAFERDHIDSNGEKSDLGTFYSISQTHGIELETFIKCMACPELGVEGFYLYALIKSKSDYYRKEWNIKLENLIKVSGLKSTKCKEVLLTLRQYRMIEVDNMPWVLDRPPGIITKANGYAANKCYLFSTEKIEVQKPIKTSWERCQKEYWYAIVDPQEDEALNYEYDHEQGQYPLPF
ncbi:hypothetical protein AMS62_16770 [Bacillus sp. FJAT-18019]|nr:hypothetical protein AMS62_16770 [Bacillus sp. FJAT-18019]